MALNNEDYSDIKRAKGKALADKVKKVTTDRKVYPKGGLGKDRTESYSNVRRSVTNFNKDYKGHPVAQHMRNNYREGFGAVGKSIARNEEKYFKRNK